MQQWNYSQFYDPGSANYNGYLSSVVKVVGRPEQQTVTLGRDQNNGITSMIDQLGRETDYSYDSNGNVLSITRLAGTQQAVAQVESLHMNSCGGGKSQRTLVLWVAVMRTSRLLQRSMDGDDYVARR